MRTALVARRLEDVTAVSRDVGEGGGVALPVRCDVSDLRAPRRRWRPRRPSLARWTLVNNAASVGPLGPTPGVLLEDWAATIRLNLIAALATISAALPGMLARGFGRIINVSSGAATGSEMLGASAYSASKAGLEMLTRNLAAELAHTGVSVAAVRPVASTRTCGGSCALKLPRWSGRRSSIGRGPFSKKGNSSTPPSPLS